MPASAPPRQSLPALRRFGADRSGAVLVLWGMFLGVAFGFLALAVDFGRIAGTQSELQSFADQVALAAAAELDGRSDAITRATAAADRLITDRQTFARGDLALSGAADYTLAFLSTLPADDSAAETATTTDARSARYVRVTVDEATVPTPFAAIAAAIAGRAARDSGTVGATATAGSASYACDVTPLMFCVPDGTWRADANRGTQIMLRAGGQGAAWGPGNFGFLDTTSLPVDSAGPCAGLNGAQLYRCLVGAERAITSCLRTDQGVSTQTGQRVGLAEAFNTRFDIFTGNMQHYRSDAAYRPAPNTVQGTLPDRIASGGTAGNGKDKKDNPNGNGNQRQSCRDGTPEASDAMALPRDTCILDGSCGRVGDGTWDRTAYVTRNHGGTFPPGTGPSSSRYAMYLAEIAAASTRLPPDNVPLPGLQETGAAICHSDGATPDPERRTLIAAAVDCVANTIQGNATNIVPLEYVKLFMTEPVAAPGGESDAEIMVEVVGSAGGFGSGATVGIYREFVQLYR